MADTLQEAIDELISRSTTEGPSDTVLVINGNLRVINVPKDFIFGVYNDANVLSVPFEMPRYYAGNDLSEFSIRVNYLSATKVGGIYEVENPTVEEDKIIFEWLTGRGVFLGDGDVVFNVCLRKFDGDNVVKEYNTTLGRGSVLAGIEIDDPYDPEMISIYTRMLELEASIANVKEELQNYVGAPRVAHSSSEMSDQSNIYVYTGSETGYNNGDWYYYDHNQAGWVSGGPYNSVELDPDDLGLEQDMDTYYVYPTYRGMRSENGIPLASGGGGGGGGGGGDIVSAVLTVDNTTGWSSKTIIDGGTCELSFNWSSIEDGEPTGDGAIRITVNEIVKSTQQISQGSVTVDVSSFLNAGTNKIKVRISDAYDQGKTIVFNITVVALSISSPFDDSIILSANTSHSFPYTPVGATEKTVYFIVDGDQNDTVVTSVSGRQLSYAMPRFFHGAHSIKVYFESVLNGETVRSNELYYEFKVVDPNNQTKIITSSFDMESCSQYSAVQIPYYVYDPTTMSSEVTISDNGTTLTSLTVDRSRQTYSYKATEYGTRTIVIASGIATKTITLEVTELDINVSPETEDLSLYLSSQGRSNNEAHPDKWEYGSGSSKISCIFNNFTWTSDGWRLDNEGNTVMRVTGDARLTIPYKLFGTDFRATGKTIELEFATSNILNYDATIISCQNGGRGMNVTAQKAVLKSEQSEISTQYKEDEHVRIAFVIEKRSEHRLLFIYINGIASGVVQYPVDDDFSQVEPVDITVGSNDCTVDLYCIRIYDNNLTRNQIVENWIADTTDSVEMLSRYTRNNVYDAYGNIVVSALPSDLPYLIIECPELPQYKGDKKTCNGSYTDPLHPSKSFTFTGAQFDVQGTSSQYYPRKNYKAKFKGGFTNNGTTSSKYAMNTNAVPTSTFTFKADVASSEGANNVELARLYNDACPYRTAAQEENNKVRQGIDGFPIVIFWNDGNTTTFLGKYNFNNDKGTAEVFGLKDPDESWEIKNNTSDRVRWKSADYTGSGWLNDFEARYPDTDPAYENPAQLSEFAAWLVTTDTTAATNAALPSAVEYGGVAYTTDSAEYRLAKFKAEASHYMEMDSTLFYYLFTELFLMVDSRAKNAFPSFIGGTYGD